MRDVVGEGREARRIGARDGCGFGGTGRKPGLKLVKKALTVSKRWFLRSKI
jgi:hypothetical protein